MDGTLDLTPEGRDVRRRFRGARREALCELLDGWDPDANPEVSAYVDELVRLGASITTTGHHAVIRGVDHFVGTSVRGTDIRACAALVLAGLVADGESPLRGKYDLIIANATFQWVTRPAATLANYYRSLAPGGILSFSTLGPRTFQELAGAPAPAARARGGAAGGPGGGANWESRGAKKAAPPQAQPRAPPPPPARTPPPAGTTPPPSTTAASSSVVPMPESGSRPSTTSTGA